VGSALALARGVPLRVCPKGARRNGTYDGACGTIGWQRVLYGTMGQRLPAFRAVDVDDRTERPRSSEGTKGY
jgi:hypothetical protein